MKADVRLALAAALAAFSAGPTLAQTRDANTPNQSPLREGSTVANKANANEKSPGTGITRDLAPEDKQSATGGPVGGGGVTGASSGY